MDPSEIQRVGWCDVELLGIAWISDGRDLALTWSFPGTNHGGIREARLCCRWASRIRIDLDCAGGLALTWNATFEPVDAGWDLQFDFASTGTLALRCTEIELDELVMVARQ